MDIAEEAAKAQKEDDINVNYQFINAKNLTNSAPNNTEEPQEVISKIHMHSTSISTVSKCKIATIYIFIRFCS